MATHLAEAVSEKIRHAASLYHRLVLVVSGPGMGKTGALRNIAKSIGVPVVNVNLEQHKRGGRDRAPSEPASTLAAGRSRPHPSGSRSHPFPYPQPGRSHSIP